MGKQTAETFYLQKLGKQAQEKRQQEEKSAKQDEQLAQSKHSAQQYKLLHQGALKKLTRSYHVTPHSHTPYSHTQARSRSSLRRTRRSTA